MLLRPRKTNYINSHKKRSYKTFSVKVFYNNFKKLKYGQFGIKNLNHSYTLYNKYLIKIKIFLKKSTRRSNITNRSLWFSVFPHIPVTKKVIGSRMGKGKGKLSNWSAKIPLGLIFIELRNLHQSYFSTSSFIFLPSSSPSSPRAFVVKNLKTSKALNAFLKCRLLRLRLRFGCSLAQNGYV